VFNIQRFSVHDGPGIRTTVFLKGCPLRCLWCHNPESMAGAPELTHVESRCIHCGQCIEACPTGYLEAVEGAEGDADGGGAAETRRGTGGRSTDSGGPEDDLPLCDLCGACVDVCPAEARRIVGRAWSVPDLVEELVRDRPFFDESGGGVTFSGGEPLMQPGFLFAALEACRDEGLRTAVDTSGFCRTEHLLRAAPLTGVFLYDLKHMDPQRHRELTGVANRRILDNARALAAVHDDVRIRVPVVPGLNDDPDHIEALARFAASLPGVRRVHLLPYHALGLRKRARLGRSAGPDRIPRREADPAPDRGDPPHDLDAIPKPDPAHMRRLAALVATSGLEPHIGG
jgi:pyruvate formate lyase activating enzyme